MTLGAVGSVEGGAEGRGGGGGEEEGKGRLGRTGEGKGEPGGGGGSPHSKERVLPHEIPNYTWPKIVLEELRRRKQNDPITLQHTATM